VQKISLASFTEEKFLLEQLNFFALKNFLHNLETVSKGLPVNAEKLNRFSRIHFSRMLIYTIFKAIYKENM
jgi:hypothetical protein